MLGARMFEDDNWDDASCLCTRWFTCGSVSVGVGSWGRSWWELGTVGGEQEYSFLRAHCLNYYKTAYEQKSSSSFEEHSYLE